MVKLEGEHDGESSVGDVQVQQQENTTVQTSSQVTDVQGLAASSHAGESVEMAVPSDNGEKSEQEENKEAPAEEAKPEDKGEAPTNEEDAKPEVRDEGEEAGEEEAEGGQGAPEGGEGGEEEGEGDEEEEEGEDGEENNLVNIYF